VRNETKRRLLFLSYDFLAHFAQDRLGTRIQKVEEKRPASCTGDDVTVTRRRGEGDDTAAWTIEAVEREPVRKTPLLSQFRTAKVRFTKTGSGQKYIGED
jgi:hypothetical protein